MYTLRAQFMSKGNMGDMLNEMFEQMFNGAGGPGMDFDGMAAGGRRRKAGRGSSARYRQGSSTQVS